MKTYFIILFFSFASSLGYSQCFAPTNLFESNINYYNAQVNWTPTSTVNYFRIRYKETSSTSWLYINNIDSALTTKQLLNLTPLTDYIWQIKSYCDTSNNSISSWSVADSFTTITNNCPNTNNFFTTNINYNTALANWDTVSGANRYKVRYKVLGTTAWLNLSEVSHPGTYRWLPSLQQSTIYEWQIKTYHDSTTLSGSLWSASDTFTTTLFVPAPFNPIVTPTLGTLECNAQTELYLKITQAPNEPDIGTGVVVSDGGSFNLSSINSGDSVGHAIMTTSSQAINAVLEAGIILGQNYAIINSYDSTGTLIGFFTIENDAGGVKIEILGSPNDGNNYTNGYVSDIYFTNLFINPQNPGPLHFFTDINSELNDQIYTVDTAEIWCHTTQVANQITEKKDSHIVIYDALGRKNQLKEASFRLIRFSNGRVEKRIVIKK